MAHKVKHRHIKAKHQKKRYFRANDPLWSVFMWGVNQTFSSLDSLNLYGCPISTSHLSILPSEVTELVRHVEETTLLLPEDFKASSKIRIENQHYNKDNLPGHFKVKEYCPLVFRDLRRRFLIDDVEYKDSLTKSAPVPMDSSGRSGVKFYTSYDKRFIIKGLSSEEVSLMLHLIQNYHAHIVTVEGQTLLPELLGMYRLTVADKETYWIVSRSVVSSRIPTHSKYDLKGSTIDRIASTKEKAKSSPTLKDVDFTQTLGKIKIGDEAKTDFIKKVEADVGFLQKQHLMDYSLLVGVHYCKQYPPTAENRDSDSECVSEGEDGDSELTPEEQDGEDSADINGDISSEGSTPTSPTYKSKTTQNKMATSSPRDTQTDSNTSTTGKSREEAGETEKERHTPEGRATALPLPNPALVHGPKAVEVAKSEGKWPIVDLSVDKFAILGSSSDHTIYFMAIIDMLTLWSAKKKAAHAAKTVKHGAGAEISTVNPDQYGRRFIEFLNRVIE